jgi:hypothetical protein
MPDVEKNQIFEGQDLPEPSEQDQKSSYTLENDPKLLYMQVK